MFNKELLLFGNNSVLPELWSKFQLKIGSGVAGYGNMGDTCYGWATNMAEFGGFGSYTHISGVNINTNTYAVSGGRAICSGMLRRMCSFLESGNFETDKYYAIIKNETMGTISTSVGWQDGAPDAGFESGVALFLPGIGVPEYQYDDNFNLTGTITHVGETHTICIYIIEKELFDKWDGKTLP